MPKASEQYYDSTGKLQRRETGADEDAIMKGKSQDASGLGSKVSGSAFKPPKMNPGEDSSSYAARVAAARRAHEAAEIEGQKKAIKGLK